MLNEAVGKLSANVLLNDVEVNRNIHWYSDDCEIVEIDNEGNYILGNIVNTNGVIDEYVFNVTAGSTGDYVIGTPPVGYDFEMQLYDDPRYFYNKKGLPMSVKHLEIGDCIEVTNECFSTAPTLGTSTVASVSSGKLVAAASGADAPFKILGQKHIDIGGEAVITWVLMKVK